MSVNMRDKNEVKMIHGLQRRFVWRYGEKTVNILWATVLKHRRITIQRCFAHTLFIVVIRVHSNVLGSLQGHIHVTRLIE